MDYLDTRKAALTFISDLYSRTESAVRCSGTVSDFFPVMTEVRQVCILAPTFFNACGLDTWEDAEHKRLREDARVSHVCVKLVVTSKIWNSVGSFPGE